MKKTIATFAGIALVALSGQAFSAADTAVGKKIYDRSFGRGCGTCHDIASNPQLPALIKSGQLDRAKFEEVLKNGRGGMPKAIEEIMKQPAVSKAGMSEADALDSLYEYLKTK